MTPSDENSTFSAPPTVITMADGALQTTFLNFKTPEEVANSLQVPVGAIYCAEILKGATCGIPDCRYPALCCNSTTGARSGPRCCVHRQKWFPMREGKMGTRGFHLLGPQYLRPLDGAAGRNPCICSDRNCLGIGYSPYMVSITANVAHKEQIVKALCGTLHSSDKQEIMEKITNKPETFGLHRGIFIRSTGNSTMTLAFGGLKTFHPVLYSLILRESCGMVVLLRIISLGISLTWRLVPSESFRRIE